jgi:pyrimidine operon attenuation protein/uracil phosphoribosyltransferase
MNPRNDSAQWHSQIKTLNQKNCNSKMVGIEDIGQWLASTINQFVNDMPS